MTPEQFLKKWVEPAARGLKVLPEKLAMKDDLEAVIRAENQALQNVIDRQAEDLRCFENQGHNWGEEMIRKSNPNWIQQATRGMRPELFDIESRFIPDCPDKDGSFVKSDFEEALNRMAKHHEASIIPEDLRQNDHVEDSPFCFPNFIKYGNDFGIKRPGKPLLIVDCDHPPETLTRKSYSISGSPESKSEFTLEEYEEALKNRERKASEERMREFDEDFDRPDKII